MQHSTTGRLCPYSAGDKYANYDIIVSNVPRSVLSEYEQEPLQNMEFYGDNFMFQDRQMPLVNKMSYSDVSTVKTDSLLKEQESNTFEPTSSHSEALLSKKNKGNLQGLMM